MRIRKKVLGQNVPVTFTTNHRQRPVAEITHELCDIVIKIGIPSEFAPFLEQPSTLVGQNQAKVSR